MLKRRRKRHLDDEIGPSEGIIKWVNKFFRFVLFPVIHPVAFVASILIAALIVLLVPAYFGVELKDTFSWYKNQLGRSYAKIEQTVDDGHISAVIDQTKEKVKEAAELAINVRKIDQKPGKEELVVYDVPSIGRRAFQTQKEEKNDMVVESKPLWRGEIYFKRAEGLGLTYLDIPQKISGEVRVVNANELRVGDQLIFLYGIYVDPSSEDGKKAEEYLRDVTEGRTIDCFIGAYARDGNGTAICFCQGKNINQTLVDLQYSRNVTLN